MKSTQYAVILTLAVFVFALHGNVCLAQVDRGTPPFQSFGGGPDVINLGKLNVHYSIPVFSRPGRGIPFNYALAYDSSVWTISGGAWIPASSTWGLQRDVAATVGVFYVRFTSLRSDCDSQPGGFYSFGPYVDSAGTSHDVFASPINENPDCINYSKTTTAIDGSGITVTATGLPSASITLKSGQTITPLLSSYGSSASGNATDSNGNSITSSVSGTTTKFYDTLSTTTPVLTIDASNASAVKYEYASPANPAAQAVASYKNYTVQTNFQCPSVNEYGPIANVSLIDKITLADGSYYQFSYEQTPISGSQNVTGRLASLRLPTGGTISYSYQGGDKGTGVMCVDGSTSGFDRTTPDGTWQYQRTGTSPAYTTTITSPADPVTGQNNVTVINFQGNYETQRQVYQGAATGTPLTSVITCYNGNLANCNTTAVTTPFSQITKFTQFNGGSQVRLDTFYDGYGSVTETDQYDFGASTPTQKTTTLYGSYVSASDTCTALTNGIVDHPCKVTVADGSGNLKAKTTYGYDETAAVSSGVTTNHVSVTGSRGNLTTVTKYATSTATLTSTFKNYDTGMVYQSQDLNGQWTTYTYGSCAGAFPTNVSMPLSLSRSSAWNCSGGVSTSVTDENTNTSYVNYTTDPYFWRPESTKDPLLYITNLSYPSLMQTESKLPVSGTSSAVDIVTTLDSLGRQSLTQVRQAPGSANFDSSLQWYDSFGRPAHATMPYLGTLGQNCCGAPATTTYYDALDRPIQELDGSNTVVATLTYQQNDTYLDTPAPSGEQHKRKQSEYDGLGRLTSVCEITGGANSGPCAQNTPQTGYFTAYVYDTAPNVNSLTVTQNGQSGGGTSQTRTYIHDMLGRLTQETNPETATTNYVYDSDTTCTGSYQVGNLVKKTDAVGNVTCYTYDQLHRLLSVTYPSGSYATNTDKKYFVYDSATVGGATMQNPKGRLAEAYTCPPTGSCATKKTDLGFSYSARGEAATVYEKTPNSGSTYYQVSATYWAHGGIDVLSSNLTGLPTVTYGTLEGEGRATGVTASTGQSPLVSAVTYTTSGTTQPIGSLTQVTFGSSDYDTFSYDVHTGRMNQYKFVVGATPQTVTSNLNWNANGSLGSLAITDQLNSADTETCNYSHDDLGRIASANCGTPWNQTFTYDPFGNISKSATAGISFLPQYSESTNRYFSVPGCTPSYDANGFATNDCAHIYTWDSAGNPRTIDSVGLTYDALGRMIEQASGSNYTQIVYRPGGGKLALMNAQTLKKAFVPLPAGAAAVYTSTGLTYYRHSDWLGSGRLATTSTRTLYFDVAYGPYGEGYVPSGTVDLNFTGQNQDTVSGLYDFLYREYNANQGRWPWPDPAGMGAVSLGNPQSWNRYAYVLNNPLALLDSLGLSVTCDQNGNCTVDVWAQAPNSLSREGGDTTLTGSMRCPNDGPCPTKKPANNGFTLGVRAPGQSFNDCMKANAGNYSLLGVADFALDANGKIADNFWLGLTPASNTITSVYNAATGSLSSLVQTGPMTVQAGMGTAVTYGRRTSSIMSPNLAGTPGGPKGGFPALGSAPSNAARAAAKAASYFKLAVDAGFFLAEGVGCAIPMNP
jgi:RHS repeat-associated protein